MIGGNPDDVFCCQLSSQVSVLVGVDARSFCGRVEDAVGGDAATREPSQTHFTLSEPVLEMKPFGGNVGETG